MYRTGHLGTSLLVFAPVGYLLVVAGYPVAAFVTGATMLWLTMLPDVDHRLPLVSHRGPTHSILFAGAVGAGFAVLGGYLGEQVVALPREGLVPLGFVVGFVAVGAHLLADLLTPAGVPLFWPLSDRRQSLSLTRADSAVANSLLLLLGLAAVGGLAFLLLQGGVV